MTSRRSSGSIRADRAVEPTKSENITVTWRRSAVSRGDASCSGSGGGEHVHVNDGGQAVIGNVKSQIPPK